MFMLKATNTYSNILGGGEIRMHLKCVFHIYCSYFWIILKGYSAVNKQNKIIPSRTYVDICWEQILITWLRCVEAKIRLKAAGHQTLRTAVAEPWIWRLLQLFGFWKQQGAFFYLTLGFWMEHLTVKGPWGGLEPALNNQQEL